MARTSRRYNPTDSVLRDSNRGTLSAIVTPAKKAMENTKDQQLKLF